MKISHQISCMKLILTIATMTLISIANSSAQTLYKATNATVSFFSKTPIEDIDGKSEIATTLINLETKDIAFMVQNNSFKFPNKLMQEHFNEKYMESEKYPASSFRGNIQEDINLKVAGTYKVTVKGKLTIHGITQERTIPGTIIVNEGSITLESDFKVKNIDHEIKIPSLVVTKIAEELDVKVVATLFPKK
jgi:polyisoprenoid-binding protein YceI